MTIFRKYFMEGIAMTIFRKCFMGGIAMTIFRKCFMEMNWFTNLCAVVGLCEPDWEGWADLMFDDVDTDGYTNGPLNR